MKKNNEDEKRNSEEVNSVDTMHRIYRSSGEDARRFGSTCNYVRADALGPSLAVVIVSFSDPRWTLTPKHSGRVLPAQLLI